MDQKTFFSSLFDFSFKEFVTTRIVKFIYGLALLMAGIGALGTLATGLASRSAGGVLLALILAPILFVAYVILARVWLELVIVIFRIAENVQIIADAKVSATPVCPTTASPESEEASQPSDYNA